MSLFNLEVKDDFDSYCHSRCFLLAKMAISNYSCYIRINLSYQKSGNGPSLFDDLLRFPTSRNITALACFH